MNKPRAKRVPKVGEEKFMARWTIEEDNNLLEQIKTLAVEDIGKIHQRSVGAICSRLAVLAVKLIEEGKSQDEAIAITHASKIDITRHLSRIEAKKKISTVIVDVTPKLVQVTTPKIISNKDDNNPTVLELKERLDSIEEKLDLIIDFFKIS